MRSGNELVSGAWARTTQAEVMRVKADGIKAVSALASEPHLKDIVLESVRECPVIGGRDTTTAYIKKERVACLGAKIGAQRAAWVN